MCNHFLALIPWPHIYNSDIFDGWSISIPDECNGCIKRQCYLNKSTNDLNLCSYGFNYIWIDHDLLIMGVVLLDHKDGSAARSKKLNKYKNQLIKRNDLLLLKRRLLSQKEAQQKEILDTKSAIISEYKKNEMYKNDFIKSLVPEIHKAFSSLHDYKGFISQVSQNINVILEIRYPHISTDEKLSKALHPEKAIYWASKLMDEKLKISLYLSHPEQIDSRSVFVKFSLHQLLIKYLRIYQMNFDTKGIKVSVVGESYGRIYSNPEAVPIIIHTFIDNALKYSPKNSQVQITFDEDDEKIKISVSSFGPKILDNEKNVIFEPFKRGCEAEKLVEEGTGFGLYASKVIALRLGTDIQFEQKSNSVPKKGYWTTFWVTFPRED